MGKNTVIITAGGSSTRINHKKKKQFIEIRNRPLLFWTIDKFADHKNIDNIIITLPESEIESYKTNIEKEFPQIPIQIIKGGKNRQESVYQALSNCDTDTDFVFIHDGVRPFVSNEEIEKLYQKALLVDAVIPAFKVKNTIKQIDREKVIKTLSRPHLVAALTPQVFRYSIIWECHQKAKQQDVICTDDAALMEHCGLPVYWMECSANNFKITEPFDLKIAEILLNSQLEKKI
ncbi:MAG: 2-C-methyl-D-erythritol 4-phosphate cytidylyltransferase [Candidatus Cloacimonetes bacterium]|nr:2-C-methyl-D-erythritol 4-phosphate cytidylyltransferase [Candidatus Cloacimonadota bacterium]